MPHSIVTCPFIASRLTLTLCLGPVNTSSSWRRRPLETKVLRLEVFLLGREAVVMIGTAMLRDGRGRRMVEGRVCANERQGNSLWSGAVGRPSGVYFSSAHPHKLVFTAYPKPSLLFHHASPFIPSVQKTSWLTDNS